MTSPAARKFIQQAFSELKEHELREVVKAISSNLPGSWEITVPLCESFAAIGIDISEEELRLFEKALFERNLNVARR